MTGPAVGRAAALVMLVLLMPVSLVWANDPPQLPPGVVDPGAERERESREFLERERRREEAGEIEDPVDGPDGPRGGNLPEADDEFTLDDVRFSASVFLDESFLRSVAADYIDRPVTFSQLNNMLDRINLRYRQRGLITAAAYIPPQTIEDGILRVELLEGRLGDFQIEGAAYTSPEYLRGRLPVKEGEVIDVPALRRSINRVNKHTPLSLRAGIEPGERTGESDISITVAEPPRIGGQVFIDNNGAESTGEWRAGLVGTLNGPLGRADRLTAYGVYAEGSRNGVLRYELPVNRHGGRVDLSWSVGRIEVIEGPFVDLDITGDSSETAISYRQPIYSGQSVDVLASGRYGVSESTSEIADTVISDFAIDESNLRLELSGGSRVSFWRIGQGVSHARVEALNAPTETFMRYPGDASWVRRLDSSWSSRLRLDWQWTVEDNLPSSLTYQLGGSSTVRGYDSGVSSGARGYLASAGLDYRWQPGLQQNLFIDYGQVDVGEAGRDRLTSVGTGFTWQPLTRVIIEAEVGVPLNDVTPDQDDARAHVRLTWQI